MTVRTRFAPSPTGYLHIGGVRTALFNWLYARRHGGAFILRIDDTDQQRNVQEALQPILHGLKWLGLDWDEGPEVGGPCQPYYQSQRQPHYQAAVDRLLERGLAYRDYARPDEIEAERQAAQSDSRPFRYSRRWMAETDSEQARLESEGRQAVVRLKMPRDGTLTLHDLVRGPVQFDWANEQDHVIQRADGTFIYHLATVVDDAALSISHVIRAEEHLSNTPRQVFIAQALGSELPQFAHLPYVAEPGSKTKLSKRKVAKYLKSPDFKKIHAHGEGIARRLGLETSADTLNPVMIDFYEQVGYLPDALVNYLLLLGWSLDDHTEEFSRAEMIEQFSLQRVTKSPASFDPQKLIAFQDRYMQRMPAKQKAAMVLPYLQRAGMVAIPPPCDTGSRLVQVVKAAGDRIKVAGDILDFVEFFLPDDKLSYDSSALEKRLRKPPEARGLLATFRDRLAQVEPFEAEALERLLHEFVETEGIKIGQIVHALRVAVTGKGVGMGIFETLEILGLDSTLNRINQALAQLDA